MDIPGIEQQVRRNVGAGGEQREFGTVHWAVRADDPHGAETTFGLATFVAGSSNAEHTHPNAEEVVYVLEGEVTHTLGAQRVTLRAGDLIVVPRDVPHRLINESGADMRAIIVFSTPDRLFVPVGDDGAGRP